MDPKKAQKSQARAQKDVRTVVNREVTAQLKGRGRGPQSPVEDAIVRAIYAPDTRLG